MYLIIATLPMVTKDLPISPRFMPYNLLSRCKSVLLQVVNQWLNFSYTHVLTLSVTEERTQILL